MEPMPVLPVLRALPLFVILGLSQCYTTRVLDKIHDSPTFGYANQPPVTSIGWDSRGLFRLYFGDELEPDSNRKACTRKLAPLHLKRCPWLRRFKPAKRFLPVTMQAGQTYIFGINILLTGGKNTATLEVPDLPKDIKEINEAWMNQEMTQLYLADSGVCFVFNREGNEFRAPQDSCRGGFPLAGWHRLRVEPLWNRFTFVSTEPGYRVSRIFRPTPEMPIPPDHQKGVYHGNILYRYTAKSRKIRPQYVLLLPFAIVADVITSPFQIFWFIVTKGKGLHGGPF